MADLGHRANRIVDQQPTVVHDRLLQLAARLRDELPPIEPGSQASTALGMSGRLDVEIQDRGPGRIEIRTTGGRIRGEGAADIAPTADGRTNLTVALEVKPQGFAANLMLGVALRTMPGIERQVIDGLEANLDSLAAELARPDGEWDPGTWQPAGLPGKG
jgi:carbon monoxide dehydrogenase subunit G